MLPPTVEYYYWGEEAWLETCCCVSTHMMYLPANVVLTNCEVIIFFSFIIVLSGWVIDQSEVGGGLHEALDAWGPKSLFCLHKACECVNRASLFLLGRMKDDDDDHVWRCEIYWEWWCMTVLVMMCVCVCVCVCWPCLPRQGYCV
jgi:hypothetical protein